MIKLTITFENGGTKADNTVISANFDKFEKISPWLDKIKVLNEDKKDLKNAPGFIIKEKYLDS